MPSVSVKLYSVFFKALLKRRLLSRSNKDGPGSPLKFSTTARANPSFVDGVASKDIHIGSLYLRIFLPESALPQEHGHTGLFGHLPKDLKEPEPDTMQGSTTKAHLYARRSSYGGAARHMDAANKSRRSSWGGDILRTDSRQNSLRFDPEMTAFTECECQLMQTLDGLSEAAALQNLAGSDAKHYQSTPKGTEGGTHDTSHYQGYSPDFAADGHKKLPIIVQFHGGGFVTGGKDSVANDIFCRRMAKLCEAIVIAVGYRLAPEHKYPAAFDDGFEALSWLAHQANLAEYSKSLGRNPHGLSSKRLGPHSHKELVDQFSGCAVVDPWLAAHGDTSRWVLLGVSSGANIADFVARKAVQAGRLLEPVKVVAQVLMYPFFIGTVPTHSEIKLANSYFYDKSTCILAWKMFLPEEEYNLDHPVANPLVPGREPPLKHMPATLTVVGELDWMKDRAIAYSEALRKANLDAPVLEYKDAVHEFATLDFLIKSKKAEACTEDMAIWIKKYISQKGHELSY